MVSNSTDNTTKSWVYQCPRCLIKHGIGFHGTHSEAVANAPTCCGGEPMTPVLINSGWAGGSN